MTNIFEHNDLATALTRLTDTQRERAAALVIASKVERNGIIDHRIAVACFITSGIEDYETATQHAGVRDVMLDHQRKTYGLDV